MHGGQIQRFSDIFYNWDSAKRIIAGDVGPGSRDSELPSGSERPPDGNIRNICYVLRPMPGDLIGIAARVGNARYAGYICPDGSSGTGRSLGGLGGDNRNAVIQFSGK